jgi:hypothetical protein
MGKAVLIPIGERRAVLAARHGDARTGRVTIYLRAFDRATAQWRYRAIAAEDAATGRITAFAARAAGPAEIRRALDLLARIEALSPRASLGSARVLDVPADDELLAALNLQADFFRFFQVSALVVRRYRAVPIRRPFAFAPVVPPLNLMLALDLRVDLAAVLARDWPAMVDALAAPDFRDDAFGHAVGALRAASDGFLRLGRPDAALQADQAAYDLAPSARRGLRVVAGLRRLGQAEAAAGLRATLAARWPEDAAMAADAAATGAPVATGGGTTDGGA